MKNPNSAPFPCTKTGALSLFSQVLSRDHDFRKPGRQVRKGHHQGDDHHIDHHERNGPDKQATQVDGIRHESLDDVQVQAHRRRDVSAAHVDRHQDAEPQNVDLEGQQDRQDDGRGHHHDGRGIEEHADHQVANHQNGHDEHRRDGKADHPVRQRLGAARVNNDIAERGRADDDPADH